MQNNNTNTSTPLDNINTDINEIESEKSERTIIENSEKEEHKDIEKLENLNTDSEEAPTQEIEVSILDEESESLNKTNETLDYEKEDPNLNNAKESVIPNKATKDDSSFLISKTEENKEPNKEHKKHNRRNKFSVKKLVISIVLVYLDIIFAYAFFFFIDYYGFGYAIIILVIAIIINVFGIRLCKHKLEPYTYEEEDLNVNVLNGVKEFTSKDDVKHQVNDPSYNKFKKDKKYENGSYMEKIHGENVNDDNEIYDDNEEVIHNSEPEIITVKTREINREVYDEDIEFNNLCLDFKHFINENGIDISNNTLYNFFASIASSRLVFIKTENELLASKFIKLFNDYTGSNYYSQIEDERWDKTSELIYGYKDGIYSDGEFFKGFKYALANRKNVCSVSIKNVHLDKMKLYFKDYIKYINDPLMDLTINFSEFKNSTNKIYNIPKNLWIFAFASEDEDLILDSTFARSAIVLDLNVKEIEPILANIKEQYIISFGHLMELVMEDNPDKSIPEDIWKKIDALEEYLTRTASFKLDNKLFIKLENFINAYYICSNELEDALDNMINNVLLPVIYNLNFKDTTEDEESIVAIMDNIFGIENISRSKEKLDKINEKIKLK